MKLTVLLLLSLVALINCVPLDKSAEKRVNHSNEKEGKPQKGDKKPELWNFGQGGNGMGGNRLCVIVPYGFANSPRMNQGGFGSNPQMNPGAFAFGNVPQMNQGGFGNVPQMNPGAFAFGTGLPSPPMAGISKPVQTVGLGNMNSFGQGGIPQMNPGTFGSNPSFGQGGLGNGLPSIGGINQPGQTRVFAIGSVVPCSWGGNNAGQFGNNGGQFGNGLPNMGGGNIPPMNPGSFGNMPPFGNNGGQFGNGAFGMGGNNAHGMPLSPNFGNPIIPNAVPIVMANDKTKKN